MPTQIINLTHQMVNQKVKDLIENPRLPYDSAFLNPRLCQKLMVRVLNQVAPHYILLDEGRGKFDGPFRLPNCLSEEERIEYLVRESAFQILREEDVLRYFSAEPLPSLSQGPSHWFG